MTQKDYEDPEFPEADRGKVSEALAAYWAELKLAKFTDGPNRWGGTRYLGAARMKESHENHGEHPPAGIAYVQ